MPFEFSRRRSRNLKFEASINEETKKGKRSADNEEENGKRDGGREEKGSSKGDLRNIIYIYNNISIASKNWGEEGINLESCMHPSIPSCCHSRSPLSRVLNPLSRCNPLSIVVIIVIIPAKRRPVLERPFPPLDSRESGRNLSRARIPNGGKRGGRKRRSTK